MTLRVLVAAAPLFATATAFAQAPGEWSAPPPGPAPVVVVDPPRPQRWSVGLGIAGTTFGEDDNMGSESLSFSGVALAVRYKPWLHWELELLLGGGAEDTADYYGDRPEYALGYGFLSARYRFNPWSAWNGYLVGGLGAVTVAPKNSSDEQLDGMARAAFTFGGGVEWRLNRLAFQAELRGIAASATTDEMDYDSDAEGIGGASFSMSANVYF